MEEEQRRLNADAGLSGRWKRWGPYVSERSWGTVREDYSSCGDPWNHFTHAMAPHRCYLWGEDGIAAFCDRYQLLVLNHSFWNGEDPILKERLFGLGAQEGNHGEDVKEHYYHLDATPTHSYMRYLYKYPCAPYPYNRLVTENAKRSPLDREYELLDTGIFDDNRYFDVLIEYAKATPEDIAVRIRLTNRSSQIESVHYLAQLFFRNYWDLHGQRGKLPHLKQGDIALASHFQVIEANDEGSDPIQSLDFDYRLGKRYLFVGEEAHLLFTDNETDQDRLTACPEFLAPSTSPYKRNGFHRYLIDQDRRAINLKKCGTKGAAHFYCHKIDPGAHAEIYLRLSDAWIVSPFEGLDELFTRRREEADRFYATIHREGMDEEEKAIQRAALSGLLWSKQIYLFDVDLWLKAPHLKCAPPMSALRKENRHWRHMVSKRILAMPDKWEYPWFASWDLAFHTISLALVDLTFAKEQLWYLLFDQFQHPNGEIPAYEWGFSDLNPPVQAWAALRLYRMEQQQTGKGDLKFLKKCYHKLLLNFIWWVNKIDTEGNNIFEGGFLGLDNITLFDRSEEVPGGGLLEQSDGTGWMGLFCLSLMRISLELAKEDAVYEGLAVKFFEHFIYIASALVKSDNRLCQNWNEEDGFFYDVIRYDDGRHQQIKVRSLVGLIPLYAVDLITGEELARHQEFAASFFWFIHHRSDLCVHGVTPIDQPRGDGQNYLLTLMDLGKIERVLKRVWDPQEFRSPFGVRTLSKVYLDKPYDLLGNTISYQPGEAQTHLKGGNSNWRGPIWFPTNFLLVEALKKLGEVLDDRLTVYCEERGREITLQDMAHHYAQALASLFKKDRNGRRPFLGNSVKEQTDPHFVDRLLFYEHYDAETGRGLGASHQTGWSALIANLVDEWPS